MEKNEMYELMLVDHERELVFPQGMATPQVCLTKLCAEGSKRNVGRKKGDERYIIFKNGEPYKEP